MTFVYILSTYGEYGAENVCATLDPTKLAGFIDQKWPDTKFAESWPPVDSQRWRQVAKIKLVEVLNAPPAPIDGHDLHDGWGGLQLHVVPLE